MQRLYHYGNNFDGSPSPTSSPVHSARIRSRLTENEDLENGKRAATPTSILTRKPKRNSKSASSHGSARKNRKVSATSRNGGGFGKGSRKAVHYDDTDDEMSEIFVHGQLEFLRKSKSKGDASATEEPNSTPVNHVSKYMVVEHHQKAKDVWKHMVTVWGLPRPNLVISMIGGGRHLRVGPLLKDQLTKVITKTASSAKVTWILSGGLDYGIMEMIGQIVTAHQISHGNQNTLILVGVAQLHHVIARKRPDDVVKSGLTLGYYFCEHDGSKIYQDGCTLDYNHSHFILVMDSSLHPSADDITFRPELENYIANYGSYTVPVVQMLVEGGGVAIDHIASSVSNEIPVVVFDGTKRLANLISDLHRKHFEDKTALRICLGDAVKNQKYDLNLLKSKQSLHTDQLENIMSKKKSHLRIIYDTFSSESQDLDDCLLQALMQAYEKSGKTDDIQMKTQLTLSMTFNRPDVTRDLLIKHDSRIKDLNQTTDELMFTALVQNRYQFADVLIQNGFNIEKFLDSRTLWMLYSQVFLVENDDQVKLLQHLIGPSKRLSSVNGNLLQDIGVILQKLFWNRNMNIYQHEQYSFNNTDSCHCPADGMCTCTTRHSLYTTSSDEGQYISAEKHLFLMSVLFNRREMAFVFWKMIPEGMAFALFACSLSKRFSIIAKAEGNSNLSSNLLLTSSYFESCAQEILTEAYHRRRDMSFKLLNRSITQYNSEETTVCLTADNFEMREFTAHACCQSMLDELWKGRLNQHTSNLMVLIAMVIPVFILFIDFKNEEMVAPKTRCICSSELNSEINEEHLEEQSEPEMNHVTHETKQIKEENNTQLGKETINNICCCCCPWQTTVSQNCLNFGNNIVDFYASPITIFWMNIVSYLILLVLFSGYVLTQLQHGPLHGIEVVVYLWVVTMIAEKIRQAITSNRFLSWIRRSWNIFDILMYTCFVLSVVVRLALHQERFHGAVIIFSLTLCLFYIRLFGEFRASKTISTKIILVGRMMCKLLPFLIILAVLILGVGVVYSSNLYPNSNLNRDLVQQVVYYPYFQIYSEIFIDEMEGTVPSACTNNVSEWQSGQMARCPEKNVIVILMAVLYLLVTNIVVLYLIIAMFSSTYQKEHDLSEQCWKYQRYDFVSEYRDRPVFPPPIIVFCHIYRLGRLLFNSWENKRHSTTTDKIRTRETELLSMFEEQCKVEAVNKMKRIFNKTSAITPHNMASDEETNALKSSLRNQEKLLRKTYEKISSLEDKKPSTSSTF